jgi:hypothetical protein
MRGERPRRRRAAEQRDEIASPHVDMASSPLCADPTVHGALGLRT